MTITKALINLQPAESKKLIAVGITALDSIKEKMQEGRIFVSRGTTNAYVLEEMMAIAEFDKNRYVAGEVVSEGERLWAVPSEKRLPEILFTDGQPAEVNSISDALEVMEKGDIILKGANALDPQGIAGVLLAHPKGGTCGAFWGTLRAQGLHLVIPIGLEKLVVHSILYTSQELGIEEVDLADGYPTGLFPLFGEVFTEIEALQTLFNLEVLHIASGGVGGGEGSVTLLLIGEQAVVTKAFDFCQKMKTIEPFTPIIK
ncbi:MAG: hypothetical protein GF308_15660 [Candidatus Heimdallarchaeota archaeon]|nr:hypothetical protein [Candidatus Heimdallarchaeota archaeon]